MSTRKSTTVDQSNARSGFTLMEVMVALGLASLVAVGIFSVIIFLGKSMVSLSNYSEMSQSTRSAMEMIGRDFRASADVAEFDPNGRFVVLYHKPTTTEPGKFIVYNYQANSGQLSRLEYRLNENETSVVTKSNQIVFTDLESFQLQGFNLNRLPTSNPPEIKQVQLEVRLVRSAANQQQSEEIYSTRFILRNKT